MATTRSRAFGGHSMIDRMAWVAVRRPTPHGDFAAAGWPQPDATALLAQHEALCELLAELGADVDVLDAVGWLVDACYVRDPVLVTDAGAIVLQAAKAVRAPEPHALAEDLVRLGLPVHGRLTGAARADGGDMVWLDQRTLVVARGYRTNAAAHEQLAALLAPLGVDILRAVLPHDRGREHVLHLMSVVSPVRDDLAVVFEPLAPVPLLEELHARGVGWIAVDADEYETLGGNVLAVEPGVVVLVDGNPRVRRALEAEGCAVHVFEGSEVALKGAGGPTCLTAPLRRQTIAT